MFLLDKPQQKGDFANIPTEVGNCSVLMGYALYRSNLLLDCVSSASKTHVADASLCVGRLKGNPSEMLSDKKRKK